MPQIIVYDLSGAVAALSAAAERGVAVTLVSPAGAAGFAGPAWFRALVEQAGATVPDANFDAVLDCADAAGLALAAIREGVPAVCFTGDPAVSGKIADIAGQAGCLMREIDYASALDLETVGDAAAACRSWLAKTPTDIAP